MNNYGGLSVSEHRLYGIWRAMLNRCENKNWESYSRYGAKGVGVCEEWHDFPTFVRWSRANGYEDDLTIDRIDNNGNYEPSNCRWADCCTQANNTSKNIVIEVCGISGNAAQWANLLGISKYTVFSWNRRRGAEYAAERILESARNGAVVKRHARVTACSICGKEFESRTHNAKYCKACKQIAEREKSRKYQAKKRASKGDCNEMSI